MHAEVLPHLHRTLTRIRQLGLRAGVAINPSTSLDAIGEVIGDFDVLLVMSVNPGFGGQQFLPRSIDKVVAARALLTSRGNAADIEVDGGVDQTNATRARPGRCDHSGGRRLDFRHARPGRRGPRAARGRARHQVTLRCRRR